MCEVQCKHRRNQLALIFFKKNQGHSHRWFTFQNNVNFSICFRIYRNCVRPFGYNVHSAIHEIIQKYVPIYGRCAIQLLSLNKSTALPRQRKCILSEHFWTSIAFEKFAVHLVSFTSRISRYRNCMQPTAPMCFTTPSCGLDAGVIRISTQKKA